MGVRVTCCNLGTRQGKSPVSNLSVQQCRSCGGVYSYKGDTLDKSHRFFKKKGLSDYEFYSVVIWFFIICEIAMVIYSS